MHVAGEGPGCSCLPFSASLMVLAGRCVPLLFLPWSHSLAYYLFFLSVFYFMSLYTFFFFLIFYFSVFWLVSFLLCSLISLFHPTENCVNWGRGTYWSMFSSVVWLTRAMTTGESSTNTSVRKCDPTLDGNSALYSNISSVRAGGGSELASLIFPQYANPLCFLQL